MLFRRRTQDSIWTRLRVALWPRRNHARSTRYVWKRVLRIRATPHAIGLGFAAGTFASFTPFMGFHFILAFAIAWISRASFIAAGLGTAIGNPLTFPFIWAATLGLGRKILGVDRAAAGEADSFLATLKESGFAAVWDPYILPMLLGGLPLGLIAGAVFYVPVYKAAEAFQTRRAARREDKVRKELEKANGDLQNTETV